MKHFVRTSGSQDWYRMVPIGASILIRAAAVAPSFGKFGGSGVIIDHV